MRSTPRRDPRLAVARRGAVVALLAFLALLSVALPAHAHAAFVSSRPEPGTQLAAAPGFVEVTFTEPLIAELSSLSVTDPDGGVWDTVGFGDKSMQVGLDTNSQGVYEVEWRTVSPLDGHTLRGGFRFGVGVIPADTAPSSAVRPGTTDLVVAVARAAEYAALLLAVGMLVAVALARRDPPLVWVRPRLRAALGVALVAGAVVVAGEALLAAVRPSAGAVARYLAAEPGLPRLARLGAEGAAVVAISFRARKAAGAATVGAIAALAAAGHAAAARPAWWGITVDAAHLVAAGIWAGAILGFATLRPPGGWRSEHSRVLLRRFTPVGVAAFVATVAFGTLRGAQELVGFADLVSTSYGQVLLVKIAVVAAMVPLSWRAWRRRDARPRVEAALVVVAVGAAALMAAYPVPPRRAAEDAHAAADPAAAAAIPTAGDLTLAGETADVLVGLTLRPGRPGRNDVLVRLVPPAGEADAADLDAELIVAGRTQPLERCGPACRRTTAVLRGGDDVAVRVAGAVGDPAQFTLPALPAPDGRELLEEAITTMAGLDSLRYHEVFGPVTPPIISDVAMVAPDRLRSHITTLGRTTVRIGDDVYRREAGGKWDVELDGAPLRVPVFVWEYTPRIAPRVVAHDHLRGVDTKVVSFFIDHSTGPIWYRLWVDADHLVRRAEMRAQGHFMDHDYTDFDAPIEIRPPVAAPNSPDTSSPP